MTARLADTDEGLDWPDGEARAVLFDMGDYGRIYCASVVKNGETITPSPGFAWERR